MSHVRLFARIAELDRLYLRADALTAHPDYGRDKNVRRRAHRAWCAYYRLRDDKTDLRRCLRALGRM
jgi:hypothetical protein